MAPRKTKATEEVVGKDSVTGEKVIARPIVEDESEAAYEQQKKDAEKAENKNLVRPGKVEDEGFVVPEDNLFYGTGAAQRQVRKSLATAKAKETK